jgi:hypothetical protein
MATGQLGDSAQPVVTVQHLPGGEVYAVVADPAAIAHTSVSADRSSVTVSLRLNGGMPCSIIFPDYVATQAFGPAFATMFGGARGQDLDGGQ